LKAGCQSNAKDRLHEEVDTTSDCQPVQSEICSELLGSCVVDSQIVNCDEYFAEHGIGNPTTPCNPCGNKCPVPTLEESWGGIKALYR